MCVCVCVCVYMCVYVCIYIYSNVIVYHSYLQILKCNTHKNVIYVCPPLKMYNFNKKGTLTLYMNHKLSVNVVCE